MGLMQSLQEKVRHHKRQIAREVGRVDRELVKLQSKRTVLCKQLKHYAEKGEMTAFRSVLKQIVQSDKQAQVYQNIKLNCTAMEHKLSQVHSTAALQKTLKDSVKVMTAASRGASVKGVNQSVHKYMQKMEETDLKLELIDDACNDAFGDSEAEEELEQRILDELQIDLKQALPSAPKLTPRNISTRVQPERRRIGVKEAVMDEPIFNAPQRQAKNQSKPKSAPELPKEQVYDGVAEALYERMKRLSK